MSNSNSNPITARRLSCLLATLVLLNGCDSQEPPAATPRLVRSTVVATGADGETASYTGEIHSSYETDLSFQVGGKVISRSVDAGTMVQRGQVLAQLDSTDQQTSVDAARAAVSAAAAEHDRARTEEARYRDLLERGLTTGAAYLTQQTTVKTTRSRLEQANADLRLSRQRLGYTTLRADQDGIVTRVMAEAGAVIAVGEPAISIAQPSELEAVFDVPDSRIDEVRSAAAAQIALRSDPARLYPAKVREISPSADPVTRTYQVKASLPDPPQGLRLGMTVTVILPHAKTHSSVVLPATALSQQDRNTAVWVVKPDHTLELRRVEVERYESDRVVIREGLASGERIVTAGVHRLSAGEKVRLLEETKP